MLKPVDVAEARRGIERIRGIATNSLKRAEELSVKADNADDERDRQRHQERAEDLRQSAREINEECDDLLSKLPQS
jgi:hypothetical protein